MRGAPVLLAMNISDLLWVAIHDPVVFEFEVDEGDVPVEAIPANEVSEEGGSFLEGVVLVHKLFKAAVFLYL